MTAKILPHMRRARHLQPDPDCPMCHGDGTIYLSARGGHDPDGCDVPCPSCFPQNPRERGDDDGVEYADPRD